ncbi:MAG TPA: NRDE family protein [Burkholderiales bacterium]
MCLILAAWRAVEGVPLVVAANRDEFHARPAAPAQFWEDIPAILAGRDLQAMGTWMGVARNGRFAAVTNYRGAREPSAPHSRGALVTGFLNSTKPAGAYVSGLDKHEYSGFNLLAYDSTELWWLSNRDGAPRPLEPGIYGLGNLLLDSPEVEPAKARFREAISPAPAVESLFGTLAAARIVDPVYGTRCSTGLILKETSVRYAERAFAPDGEAGETLHFEFKRAP